MCFVTALDLELLASAALDGELISDADAERILLDPDIELLDLVSAAFRIRRARWGKKVQVHILNNAANGKCPEDCSYCTQGKLSLIHI